MAERTARLQGVAEAVVREEEKRPAKLAVMAHIIDKEARNDAAKLAWDGRELNRMADREVKTWIANQPNQWQAVGREIWGKPEGVPLTFIDLFY